MDQNCSPHLPVKGKLTLLYILSFLIAVLVAAVSIAGLGLRALVYPTQELIRDFVPNDVINLSIGFPALLVSLLLYKRNKLIGLLLWIGALLYVFYSYLAYVFAVPLNWAYPGYLVLIASSLYTLIALVMEINGEIIRQRLARAVPERFAGGVLAGLGLLFCLRVIGVLVSALQSGIQLDGTDLAVNISDFLVLPTWLIGGVLLWRRKALGYVLGLGLLFQGSLLFIALILLIILQSLLESMPLPFMDVAVVLVMGMICFIPLGMYIRGIVSKKNSISTDCGEERSKENDDEVKEKEDL